MLGKSHFLRLGKCKSRDKRLRKLKSQISRICETISRFFVNWKSSWQLSSQESPQYPQNLLWANAHSGKYERTENCFVGRHDVAFHFLSLRKHSPYDYQGQQRIYRDLNSAEHKVCAIYRNVAVKTKHDWVGLLVKIFQARHSTVKAEYQIAVYSRDAENLHLTFEEIFMKLKLVRVVRHHRNLNYLKYKTRRFWNSYLLFPSHVTLNFLGSSPDQISLDLITQSRQNFPRQAKVRTKLDHCEFSKSRLDFLSITACNWNKILDRTFLQTLVSQPFFQLPCKKKLLQALVRIA